MSTCPTTGAAVSTGMQVTPADYDARGDLGGSFRCSSCGRVHAWAQKQAWVTRLHVDAGAVNHLRMVG